MTLPILRMEQTYAKLGLRITKPVQEIHQPKAQLNMRQIHARLEMHTTDTKLILDASEARADIGLKSVARANAEYAAKGRRAALEGIAKIAREGIALRSIETGGQGQKLKQISKQNFNKPMLDSQITFLPRYGSLKIDWIPGELSIQVHKGGVEMDPFIRKPIHNYTPGNVQSYLIQKGSIRTWIDYNVDMRL